MKRSVLALLLCCGACFGQQVSDRIIVKTKPLVKLTDVIPTKYVPVKYYPETNEYVVLIPEDESIALVVTTLISSNKFEYVEIDDKIIINDIPANDPLVDNQWHHNIIWSNEAWRLTTGITDIICAFTDTGVDLLHEDIGNHILGYNAWDNVAEIDGGIVQDDRGHGTHVLGSATALGNNHKGIAGVGWNLSSMMIKINAPNQGYAYLSDALEGARWAVDHGARIISTSFSGVGKASIETTGKYIRLNGGIYVYAAGNSDANLSAFDHAHVVVVGATDINDEKAEFSNYGRGIDVFAPGVDILSTCIPEEGFYCTKSGTSMSAPITAGALALIWSYNPGLNPDAVEQLLFNGCYDLGDQGDDMYWGHGRINVYTSINMLVPEFNRPTLVDDRAVTLQDTPVSIPVLENDIDPNNDKLGIKYHWIISAYSGRVRIENDDIIYTPPNGFIGEDYFIYAVGDLDGNYDIGYCYITVDDPIDYFQSLDVQPKPGLSVNYYITDPDLIVLPNFDNMTFYKTDVVGNVDYGKTLDEFATSRRRDEVGASFKGYIKVPETDEYYFFLSSDDGAKLLIDNVSITEDIRPHSFQERVGTVKLEAGYHLIRLDYWDNSEIAGLQLAIMGGGLNKQIIPPSMLFYDPFILDLVTFHNLFWIGDPRCDLNKDQRLDIFDVLKLRD